MLHDGLMEVRSGKAARTIWPRAAKQIPPALAGEGNSAVKDERHLAFVTWRGQNT